MDKTGYCGVFFRCARKDNRVAPAPAPVRVDVSTSITPDYEQQYAQRIRDDTPTPPRGTVPRNSVTEEDIKQFVATGGQC